MTKEEKANEYVGHPFETDEDCCITTAREAYLKGCGDQQKIDIEQACEWLKNNGCFSYLQEGSQTIEDVENLFRKAMES